MCIIACWEMRIVMMKAVVDKIEYDWIVFDDETGIAFDVPACALYQI